MMKPPSFVATITALAILLPSVALAAPQPQVVRVPEGNRPILTDGIFSPGEWLLHPEHEDVGEGLERLDALQLAAGLRGRAWFSRGPRARADCRLRASDEARRRAACPHQKCAAAPHRLPPALRVGARPSAENGGGPAAIAILVVTLTVRNRTGGTRNRTNARQEREIWA